MRVVRNNTVYIVGNAKLQVQSLISQKFGHFVIGFTINADTGLIESCGSTTMMESTQCTLNELFQGENIETDEDLITELITNNYFGSAQKAMIFAFRDARKKFLKYKSSRNS